MNIKYLGSNGVGLVGKNWCGLGNKDVYDVFQIDQHRSIVFPRNIEYDCETARKIIESQLPKEVRA